MPIVPRSSAIAAAGAQLPAQQQPTDIEIESNASVLDVAAAALRQNNVIANVPQLISDAIDSFDDIYEPDYDPLADSEIAGFEEFADRFIGVASREESARVKSRIRTELADRKVIQEAGWAGVASSIAAGVVDPVTIASMAVPLVGTGTRGVRIAKGVASSIALDSGQEAFLHAEQALRTAEESLFNVGAGALLTGALGTLATRVPKDEFNAMLRAAEEHTKAFGPAEAFGGIESTSGAARVGFGTTLEDETVAPGGEALVKTLGKINPLGRVMQSTSKRARILMQELADLPFLLNKHLKGVATPRSAEGEIKAEQAVRYRLVKLGDSSWLEHKKAGGKLSRGQFSEAVAAALRRGDKAADPAVAKVAAEYRAYFDASRKALQENGLLPDPVKADQQRLERQAVEKYVKAESSQIYTDYAARSNATVATSEFRRLLRGELDERAKPAAERAAVSEAPEPVREFADVLAETKKQRDDLDAIFESKLSTIEDVKQRGLDKAESAAEKARKEYAAARSELATKTMSREKRTIALMKLRATRDQALRDARKAREKEIKIAEKAAAAARKERAGEVAKIRKTAQEARASAVKKFRTRGAIDEKEFMKRAERVARTGEADLLEDVNKAADLLRRQELGDLSHLVSVPKTRVTQAPLGAESYLPRMWDHAKIRASRTQFEETLRDWFSRQSDIAPEEVNALVADVIDTVNGSLRDHAQIATGFVGKTGSLKGRVLNIPDAVLEPWLVSDVEKIFENYVRNVTPQLVIKKKFGDLDLRQQMDDVRDEFNAMRDRARTDESKARITEEMERTLADLQAVRDLVLGRYGRPANPDSFLVRSGRVLRVWNYVRSLGGQLFSSFPDPGRIVSRHGLARTAATIGRLVSNSGLRNLAKAEAHRVGTAYEYVLNTRADTLGDIGDEFGSSKLDRIVRRESNRFSRLSLMASWNSALKTLAVALEQDAIVRAARGGKLSKFQRGQLANLGIGDRMLARISAELDAHAVDADGIFRANSEAWADQEAAQAFEGALLKSADTVVLTKGIADTPLFMAKDIGKTLFQFKSFGMAAVNRLLIPMAQGVRHGDLATLNGAWVMMALGALANAARDAAAGYEPVTDPKRIAIEAFDRAGFTAFLAEPLDLLSGTFGGPRFGRFTSSTPEEQLVGPALGALLDVQQTAEKALTKGGEFDPEATQADLYRFRKLLPYQNLFYLRRIVNMLEGEFGEAVGAEGAGTKSAGERLTEMKELNRG